MNTGFFFWWQSVLKLNCGDGCMSLNIVTTPIVNFKWFNFVVCVLYLE